jgi:arylformamidase
MVGKQTTFESFYDISVLLGEENIDFAVPGVNAFSTQPVFRMEDGGPCRLSNLVLHCHAGTHVDAPSHFILDGKCIDEYPVQRFILAAQVVNIEDKEAIRASELRKLDINEGNALLFRTNNSKSGLCRSGVLNEKWVYMSPEAAEFCVEKKASLVGVDYIAPEKPGGALQEAPVHLELLGNNVMILEGITLEAVPPGRYTLICLPLKIKGAEASPVRAVLIR